MPTFNFASAVGVGLPAIAVFFFYDGPRPPRGLFDAFDAVPAEADSVRLRSFASLHRPLLAGRASGARALIRPNTFPRCPWPT